MPSFQAKSSLLKCEEKGKLSGENRWVKLAQLIPWEEFEAQYAEQLSEGMGAPAKSFRMALGVIWLTLTH